MKSKREYSIEYIMRLIRKDIWEELSVEQKDQLEEWINADIVNQRLYIKVGSLHLRIKKMSANNNANKSID